MSKYFAGVAAIVLLGLILACGVYRAKYVKFRRLFYAQHSQVVLCSQEVARLQKQVKVLITSYKRAASNPSAFWNSLWPKTHQK